VLSDNDEPRTDASGRGIGFCFMRRLALHGTVAAD